jgi:hypothetical protein
MPFVQVRLRSNALTIEPRLPKENTTRGLPKRVRFGKAHVGLGSVWIETLPKDREGEMKRADQS